MVRETGFKLGRVFSPAVMQADGLGRQPVVTGCCGPRFDIHIDSATADGDGLAEIAKWTVAEKSVVEHVVAEKRIIRKRAVVEKLIHQA